MRWLEKSWSQGEARNTHCPRGRDDVTADETKRNYRELFIPMNECYVSQEDTGGKRPESLL